MQPYKIYEHNLRMFFLNEINKSRIVFNCEILIDMHN